MSILFPLMAFGLLFVAVPVWLHLRRRDETNLVEFSTLRFLDDQPIARARPLWPRNWPLLLLRILALTLLVAAFTWPYWEDEQTVVVEESRIYILDNTLSHQVGGAFQAAKDLVAKELAGQDVRTQIGVVELSSTSRVVARLGDPGPTAAAAVNELNPSATRGDFVDAFRTASELLETSLGSRKRIVLLSDSQANQWTSGEDVPPFLEEVDVVVPDVSQSSRSNLSLSGPRSRRVLREGEHWIEAGAMLACRGPIERATIVFRNRGVEVAREEVTWEPSESWQETPVFATWAADPLDWVVGEISIEPLDDRLEADPMAGDDRVVFSLMPQRPGLVGLFSDSLFLQQALSPEVMQGRWLLASSDGTGDVERDSQPTEPAEILCLESSALTESSVRDAVRDSLSAGRGVMLLVDRSTPVIAGFLRDFGIEMELADDPPQPGTDPSPATFRYLFMEHPVFAPFQSSAFGDLSEVEIARYRRLNVRDAIPLAFAASGDPLVFEVSAGPGRMLVFAFAFDRDDTNWPIHPTFIPFLDKSFAYLRGQRISTTEFEPGQAIVWEAPAGRASGRIRIGPIDPASLLPLSSGGLHVESEVRNGQASFRVPDQTGHYGVRFDGSDQLDAILDVNPSPFESDLTYTEAPEALSAWQRRRDEGRSDNAEQPTTDGLELTKLEALQQHVWWFLLLAALVAFLLETAWSGRRAQQAN